MINKNYPFEFISICMAVICMGLIIFIGYSTDLLREQKSAEQSNPPYSFSRFQFWLWTLTICPIYVIYWGQHPDAPQLNGTSLKLLGIAFATTLVSNIIGSPGANNPPTAFKSFLTTDSFWTDILKDANGQFSVGRLQNLIFTLIYVVIYISYFFSCNFEYPEWDENPFILMGITSGTYLVAKGMQK